MSSFTWTDAGAEKLFFKTMKRSYIILAKHAAQEKQKFWAGG